METLTEIQKQDFLAKITKLEQEHDSSNDFVEKLELKDKIHNYKMILNGTKPASSEQYFCEGCGS